MDLVLHLGRYLLRYAAWIAMAVVSIITYAASTAAQVSLIGPIFSEVLPSGMGGGLPLLGSGDGSVDVSSRPGGLPESLSALDLHRLLGSFYDGLKATFGIEPNEVIWFVPLLFFLSHVVRMVSSFLSSYAFQHAGLSVTNDLRNDLAERILRQSARFHAEHTSGELFSRVISDVDKMQSAVSSRLLDLFQQTATLLALVLLLLSTHFRLAVICLLGAPLVLVPIVRFGKGMFRRSHRSQERMADLSSLLTEVIRGHRIVKAFGMEEFELGRFRAATDRHLRVNLRAQILSSYSSPVVETMAAAGGCLLIAYCGQLIRQGELTTGLFTQFLANLMLLYDPVRRLNKVNLVLAGALAAARRVFDLLDVPNDIVEATNPRPLDGIKESLHFDHVAFRYNDSTWVLRDFDLRVGYGQRVALVGPSGAGKSTVVNLLPRFFDPGEGALRVDGVDIREFSLADLRSIIGLVSQDTVLFNDTIRNNIAYGHREMSLEQVERAAAGAFADEFINRLPKRYDTIIGESGGALSGGQRQRLSIARAILKDAPILILDEATSHLDTQAEAVVQLALDNLMRGRTTVVIAHRLSTIMSADVIVVMDRGRIVEQGTHDELLAAGGLYRELYDLQFRS